MIKHIVLFKFKADILKDIRKQKLPEIKKSLEMLKTHISELGYIEAGINANPDESYDLALISEFSSWEDLKSYVVHPEHQKVSAVIREILQERACVDYEF
jgi:deoxycytidine triphosphate deaminase